MGLVISTGNELLNPIKGYIDQFLPDCCDRLLRSAPYHTLPLTTIPESDILGLIDGVLTIRLTANFIRIGVIQFKSWKRPVMSTITIEDPRYILQKNEYTRGGNSKPVVVLKQAAGYKVLECYTVTSGEQSQSPELTYVAKKTPEEIPDILIPALSYLVASEVFQAIEKKDLSEKALTSFALNLII